MNNPRLIMGSLAAGLVLLHACQDGEDEGAPDPSATAMTALTASPSHSAGAIQAPSSPSQAGAPGSVFQQFKEFASQIDAAVRARDTNFFIDSAVLGSMECPNLVHGDCGLPYPTTIVGIRVGVWQSEGIVEEPDNFKRTLDEYLASDPVIYSLAEAYSEDKGVVDGQEYFAVVSNSSAPSETTMVFAFINDEGTWRLSLLMGVGTPEGAVNDWTSGTCTLCYDYWERWEGS